MLLRWQLAGICNLVGGCVFLTCHHGAGAGASGGCQYRSVSVKARVVNGKQVDVTASKSFRLSWNVLIAQCTRLVGVH